LQTSGEPPYLPVGTDVSAKYRGAFCEAQVKKLVKLVKCKVKTKVIINVSSFSSGMVIAVGIR
jgi:hypothetical protein